MENFRIQAERFGSVLHFIDVTKVDFKQTPFVLWTEDDEYTADTVIVATGASARWLDVPHEARLRGRGVSTCATCDGAFFRDKHIVVVGGGDSAMEEALFLTRFGSKVTVIHRRVVVPRQQDHGRSRARAREDRGHLEQRSHRSAGRREDRGLGLRNHRDRRDEHDRCRRAVHRDRSRSEHRGCSRARSIWIRWATSSPPTA